jgi:hypothetical protein
MRRDAAGRYKERKADSSLIGLGLGLPRYLLRLEPRDGRIWSPKTEELPEVAGSGPTLGRKAPLS